MECCDADTGGNPDETAFRRYERMARGNAGVIIIEALSVVDENRGRLHQFTALPQNQKGARPTWWRAMQAGQPEAAHHLAAHPHGRAFQPRVLRARLREAVSRLRGPAADRGGGGRDPRQVRPGREDGARLRGGRRRLQALPRVPRLPAPAAVQRQEVEVRRLLGQPHAVRVRVLRAHREGGEGPGLPPGLQDLRVGRTCRAGRGRRGRTRR